MEDLVNKFVVTDENGIEHEMNILFTFEDDKGRKFVTYFDPADEEEQIYAAMYDDNGKLYSIEADEDWEMVEEVLDSYFEEARAQLFGGEVEHDHDHDHECDCEDCECEDCDCEHEEEHDCCCGCEDEEEKEDK